MSNAVFVEEVPRRLTGGSEGKLAPGERQEHIARGTWAKLQRGSPRAGTLSFVMVPLQPYGVRCSEEAGQTILGFLFLFWRMSPGSFKLASNQEVPSSFKRTEQGTYKRKKKEQQTGKSIEMAKTTR